MAAVIVLGVPGEKLSHDGRDSVFAAFKEKVDMIGHEDPCVDVAASLGDIFCKPLQESVLVLVVLKDRSFVYPPDDDVVQCSGCVKAGLSWHKAILWLMGTFVKRKAYIETTSPLTSCPLGSRSWSAD